MLRPRDILGRSEVIDVKYYFVRWDYKRHIINQPKAKELYSDLPITHLVPFDATKQVAVEGVEGAVATKSKNVIYNCPIYKVVSRVLVG